MTPQLQVSDGGKHRRWRPTIDAREFACRAYRSATTNVRPIPDGIRHARSTTQPASALERVMLQCATMAANGASRADLRALELQLRAHNDALFPADHPAAARALLDELHTLEHSASREERAYLMNPNDPRTRLKLASAIEREVGIEEQVVTALRAEAR